ncbi:hypothetical protein ACJX0J_015652, partial [Zea mays]
KCWDDNLLGQTAWASMIWVNKKREATTFRLLLMIDLPLKNHITNYYKNLFGKPDATSIELDESIIHDIPQVSDSENEILTPNFTMDEVKKEFYQVFWEVIKYDLIALIFGRKKLDGKAYDKVMLELNDRGKSIQNKCLLFCYGLAKEYDLHYSLIFGCGIGGLAGQEGRWQHEQFLNLFNILHLKIKYTLSHFLLYSKNVITTCPLALIILSGLGNLIIFILMASKTRKKKKICSLMQIIVRLLVWFTPIQECLLLFNGPSNM